MKKNLPLFLLVLFTVFAGIFSYTAYQSRSLQYKTYCINNNEQKESDGLTIGKSYGCSVNKSMNDIAGIAEKTPGKKQPEGIHGSLMADQLKNKESCAMYICLSYPGDKYKDRNKVSDAVLAEETDNIDLITGGHTHTFFEHPIICKNKKDDDIIVNQVGWEGIVSGKPDFEFTRFSGKNWQNLIQFLFHKKQEGKNFFLEKNC